MLPVSDPTPDPKKPARFTPPSKAAVKPADPPPNAEEPESKKEDPDFDTWMASEEF